MLNNPILQNLSLLIAGVLLGACVGLLFELLAEKSGKLKFILVSIAIILISILLYHGTGRWYESRRQCTLDRRTGKVGILNDMGWAPQSEILEISSYVSNNSGPGYWKGEIERQAGEKKVKIEVELIDTKKNFDPYVVILNPYGGVYPESDLRTFKTLDKILKYVKEGGAFVNVADVPGFWAYKKEINRRLNVKPPFSDIMLAAFGSFELTPFVKELGLRVYAIESYDRAQQLGLETINVKTDNSYNVWDVEFVDGFGKIGKEVDKIKVHRAAIVEGNVEPIVKPKSDVNSNRSFSVTPIFFAKYGEGKFLISLVSDTAPDNSGMRNEKIKEVIASIIVEDVEKKSKEKNDSCRRR